MDLRAEEVVHDLFEGGPESAAGDGKRSGPKGDSGAGNPADGVHREVGFGEMTVTTRLHGRILCRATVMEIGCLL